MTEEMTYKIPEELPTKTRIAFAILCAIEVYPDIAFHRWATKWLSGEDRRKSAARVAEARIWSSGETENDLCAESAAWAAESATNGAKRAHWAIHAALEASAARWKPLDLIVIAEKAMEY